MVFDSVENISNYLCLHPHFNNVCDFIKENNIPDMDEGRYEVNGQGSFAMVNEYVTKNISESFIECHLKFIDIQILLKGKEKIGVCNKAECKEYDYDPDQDLQKLAGEVSFMEMTPKRFTIFFPPDGHMTQIKYGDFPERVKKVVFKVPVLSLTA